MAGLPHIKTFEGQGRKPWRFRIVGSNGEPVGQSQGYSTKWNRDRAAKKLAKQFGIEVI